MTVEAEVETRPKIAIAVFGVEGVVMSLEVRTIITAPIFGDSEGVVIAVNPRSVDEVPVATVTDVQSCAGHLEFLFVVVV